MDEVEKPRQLWLKYNNIDEYELSWKTSLNCMFLCTYETGFISSIHCPVVIKSSHKGLGIK